MARRILNRKDLRAQAEAAERRDQDDRDVEAGEEEEAEDEAAVAVEDEAVEQEEGEDEEAAPKRKAKPVKAKPRGRAAKVTRLKAVWGVFDNANKRVAVFEYPKRQEADEYAVKLAAEKKGGSGVFFVQLVKEPLEEKKEA